MIAGPPKNFKVGSKLEAIDRKNPTMICVATITEVNKKSGEILVHFDGWQKYFDYWCHPDLTTDIHPVGWAVQNHRKLEIPQS